MKRSYTAYLLEKLARDMGASLLLQEDVPNGGGVITFSNGRRQFFMLSHFGIINPLGAAAAVRNKHCGTFLLNEFGYHSPHERLYATTDETIDIPDSTPLEKRNALIEAAWLFAQEVGLPVVIKPLSALGRAMSAKVATREEYDPAIRHVLSHQEFILVQEYYPGNDYSIIVFDQSVVAAYQRFPSGLSPDWQALDVTSQLHPDICQLCVAVCRDLNLRFASVDIIVRTPINPLVDYVIVQVNREVDLNMFANLGMAQARIVDSIFERILLISGLNLDV